MEGSILSHVTITTFILFFSILFTSTSATRLLTSNTNAQFVKASCSNTTYPKLCFESLGCYANKIQSNPKMLAHVALNVTFSATKSASDLMRTLSKLHGKKPREAGAIADCVEVVGDSVDELARSIGEMGRARGSNSDPVINDIQTWVSASLTNDDTCMDGFAGNAMNGEVKNIVMKNMTKAAHLTSVALALINSFASSQGNSALIL
ncbi:hypothetical protein P3X46_029886 [Hevea brasiliensis]|uniref:Pectinesterase inhibitor domain-containing protein n=1 Tax=Hevea brasiliensis TaxID=3981 RepID=A0ABQ9KTL5_HEVBR|nr:21 kDa protein [Hevea brasiliensis]KAJ9147763.1 hypothetical protein P3X46_029886 [Hevea brasiliensis]